MLAPDLCGFQSANSRHPIKCTDKGQAQVDLRSPRKAAQQALGRESKEK